jgi:hypothetical protein
MPGTLPDVLDGVELRRIGRQRQKRDVFRDDEALAAMPVRLIEHEDGMGAGRIFELTLVANR